MVHVFGRAVGIQGYVTKEEHLQTSDEEGAGPPVSRIVVERIREAEPRRFYVLSPDIEAHGHTGGHRTRPFLKQILGVQSVQKKVKMLQHYNPTRKGLDTHKSWKFNQPELTSKQISPVRKDARYVVCQ